MTIPLIHRETLPFLKGMTRFLLALVIAIGAAGCSPPDRIELPAHLDVSRLSTEQQTMTLEAADRWTIATGLDLTLGAGAVIPVTAGSSDGDTADTVFTLSGDASIKVDFDSIARYRRAVTVETIMHEIGHLFGLSHQPGTLMDATAVHGACVDSDSLAKACASYTCSPDAHATCD